MSAIWYTIAHKVTVWVHRSQHRSVIQLCAFSLRLCSHLTTSIRTFRTKHFLVQQYETSIRWKLKPLMSTDRCEHSVIRSLTNGLVLTCVSCASSRYLPSWSANGTSTVSLPLDSLHTMWWSHLFLLVITNC